MKQQGTVIELTRGFAKVQVARKALCGADCSTCQGSCESKDEMVLVINELDAKVGDKVILETSSQSFFTALVLTYGIPLVAFLLVSSICATFSPWEGTYGGLFAFVMGLLAVALSYGLLARAQKKKQRLDWVRMVERITP